MRAKEFIIEAKGVFGRNQGDPFLHTNGEIAEFVDVGAFPDLQTQGKQYDSPESRDISISNIEKEYNTVIQWVNAPNATSLAFAVARVQTSDGKVLLWGRYFKQVSPDMMGKWSNKEVPAGWSLQTKGAKKVASGLDPQTLIGSEQQFKGPGAVIQQVARSGDEVLTNALEQTAQGKLAVFPGMVDQLETIRDYFGEIMGPVAMMGGIVGGQADEAKVALAGGTDWANMPIFWPQSKNHNLVDSEFTAPNGVKIGVSSKGGKGAAASVKNLYDSLMLNQKNVELMRTVEYAGSIVTAIAENTAMQGPFVLGEMLGISTPALRDEVNSCIESGKRDFDGLSEEATKFASTIKSDPTKPGFNTGYAILAGLAKAVAGIVNSNPEFTKGALALLNTASIVQLYTKVSKKGDDVAVTSYEAVYPPNFKGTILLDNGKTYYGGVPKGKFAFKFN